MTAIFLQKDYIQLRPLEEDDADFLRNLYQDPDIRKHLGRVPKPHNLQQAENRVQKITEDDSVLQFIIEKEGERAGTIALFDIDRTYRHAEFGAFMVDPARHGEGIGSTALELLLEYAFEELNMHRIAGGYLEGNDSSRKVQEKFGFNEEGRERDYKYLNGEYLDLVRMSLLEHEWRD